MSKIPTIAMIPSGYKANKVYSVLPTNGDADLTFSRSGEATRVNQLGLIETVATGVPRLDYSDGGCPSLLLEPQSTNLIQYSEDFTDASWSKVNSAITSNSILSPKGDLTADLLKGDGVGAFPRIQYSVSSSGVINYSVFVKKELSDVITLFITGTGISGNTTSAHQYTFSTDTISKLSGGDADYFSSEDYGNDWIRLQITFTTTTVTDVRIYPSYNANTTNGVYVWGTQLEQQSYATSYIPTNGSTATRNAETASKSGLSNYINSSEGVLYFEIAQLNADLSVRAISINQEGTANNRYYFYYNSNLIVYALNKDGVTKFELGYDISSSLDFIKVALYYNNGTYALWFNGTKVNEQTFQGTFTDGFISRLGFDNGISSNNFYGKVKDLRVYNEALTDAELQTLTS